METHSTSETNVFEQLDTYPWKSDAEFQTGLRAILGSNPSQEQAGYLTLRAQCFYYSRKNNVAVDFDAYQEWRSQHPVSPTDGNDSLSKCQVSASNTNDLTEGSTLSPNKVSSKSPSGEEAAPYPTSFNQIVNLITTGQPIPGVKEIPDTTLAGQESAPTTAKRKKPWEKMSEDNLSLADGTSI